MVVSTPSRTFLGRGSEAGIVLLELFGDGPDNASIENYVATEAPGSFMSTVINLLETEDFSAATSPRRLHLSYSTTNDQRRATELANLIHESEYEWLEYESVSYSDSDYEHAYPTAFTDGLAIVLGSQGPSHVSRCGPVACDHIVGRRRC